MELTKEGIIERNIKRKLYIGINAQNYIYIHILTAMLKISKSGHHHLLDIQ